MILGSSPPAKRKPRGTTTQSIDDVLRDYFAKLGVPVLAHFPVGHVRYNTTLPIGAGAELDADATNPCKCSKIPYSHKAATAGRGNHADPNRRVGPGQRSLL